jgi:chromosome segregation ATPase
VPSIQPESQALVRKVLELELLLRDEVLMRESLKAENDSLRAELLVCQTMPSAHPSKIYSGSTRGSYVRLHNKAGNSSSAARLVDAESESVRGLLEENRDLRSQLQQATEDQVQLEASHREIREKLVAAEEEAESLKSQNSVLVAERSELESKVRKLLDEEKLDDITMQKLFASLDQLRRENEDLKKVIEQQDGSDVEALQKELKEKEEQIEKMRSQFGSRYNCLKVDENMMMKDLFLMEVELKSNGSYNHSISLCQTRSKL